MTIHHGYAFRGEHFRDQGPGDILLTPGNFAIGGGFTWHKTKYYEGPVDDRYVLTPGDLIITMTDLSRGADTLGSPALVPSPPDGARFLHNQRLGLVEITDPDRVDRDFLYSALRSNTYRMQIVATATGTTVKHTSPTRIEQALIPLPPLSAQRRIANVLGALDDKIDSNRRFVGLLEATAATLFRARFVDFVGVEEFEENEIGRIPQGWRVGVLADLARLRYGKALPARARRPGPVAVVGSSGVVGTHSAPLVSGPVVVVGRKGTAGSVVWIGRDAWPIDTTFFAVPADGLDPVFLYFALRHADLPHLTADSAVPGLNREAAERRLVGVPPEEEVAEFAAVARPLFRHRDAMDGESQTLAGLRDALLPKLISGQIRVPVTRDPAEVIEPAAEAFQAAAS